MTRPSYLKLMAYADGQLPPEDWLAVERHIAADGLAREQVTLLRRLSDCVARAFASVLLDPVPERLQAAATAGAPHHAKRPRFRNDRTRILMPMAAALVLVIAVSAFLVHGRSSGESGTNAHVELGPVAPTSALAHALDRFHAMQFSPASSRRQGYVVTATMRDRLGNLCHTVDGFDERSFELPSQIILACRMGPGSWSVVAAATPLSESRSTYVTSTDAAHEALNSALAMIGARKETSELDEGVRNP